MVMFTVHRVHYIMYRLCGDIMDTYSLLERSFSDLENSQLCIAEFHVLQLCLHQRVLCFNIVCFYVLLCVLMLFAAKIAH